MFFLTITKVNENSKLVLVLVARLLLVFLPRIDLLHIELKKKRFVAYPL